MLTINRILLNVLAIYNFCGFHGPIQRGRYCSEGYCSVQTEYCLWDCKREIIMYRKPENLYPGNPAESCELWFLKQRMMTSTFSSVLGSHRFIFSSPPPVSRPLEEKKCNQRESKWVAKEWKKLAYESRLDLSVGIVALTFWSNVCIKEGRKGSYKEEVSLIVNDSSHNPISVDYCKHRFPE